MGYYSYIVGAVEGISHESYDLIESDLKSVFEDVTWLPETAADDEGKTVVANKGGAIEIGSYRKHNDHYLREIYNKIAFCIDNGGGGSLQYKGDDAEDIGMVFFKERQWIFVFAEIRWPENPFFKTDDVP